MSVASELGLKSALDFDMQEGGRVTVHLECTDCSNKTDVQIARRFPPEVFRKKLIEQGWDLKRGKCRCPICNTSKTKQEEMSVMHKIKATHSDKSTALMISSEHDLFKTFVGEDGKPLDYWSMEYSIDRAGEPVLILSRQSPPEEGKLKERGKARGSVINNGNYILQVGNGVIPGEERVQFFSSTEIELISNQGRHMTFALPKSFKKPEKIPGFSPAPAVKQPEPVKAEPLKPVERVEPKPPAPQPEPARIAEQIMGEQPRIRPPHHRGIDKNSVGLVHAIQMINYYKHLMGDNLLLSIEEDGTLRAIADIK
jgi:hypothetical protein